MTSYDAAFYSDVAEGSARSARAILPLVLAVHHPTSVVDIGCGQGDWLAVAEELGLKELVGLDGAWVDRTALRSARIDFRATDLAATFALERRFDLCISVEVAEHLSAARADGFIAALCAASDVVLFSAAVPLQGGTDHVHEARASAWVYRFTDQGYDCFDLIRGALWDRVEVAWWYRQNSFVFVKRGSKAHAHYSVAPAPPPPRDLVHPDAFESKLSWAQSEIARLRGWVERPTFGQALRALWRSIFGTGS